jgi:acyl-CoA reductase-like NAD-dependent aldehyde dehydrogenase
VGTVGPRPEPAASGEADSGRAGYLTVLRISDHLRELLPPGVLNAVTGGDQLGPWITSHPGIDHISFTGSVDTGNA